MLYYKSTDSQILSSSKLAIAIVLLLASIIVFNSGIYNSNEIIPHGYKGLLIMLGILSNIIIPVVTPLYIASHLWAKITKAIKNMSILSPLRMRWHARASMREKKKEIKRLEKTKRTKLRAQRIAEIKQILPSLFEGAVTATIGWGIVWVGVRIDITIAFFVGFIVILAGIINSIDEYSGFNKKALVTFFFAVMPLFLLVGINSSQYKHKRSYSLDYTQPTSAQHNAFARKTKPLLTEDNLFDQGSIDFMEGKYDSTLDSVHNSDYWNGSEEAALDSMEHEWEYRD